MATEETSTPLTRIKAGEIRKGDVFPGPGGWTALEDASNLHDNYCSVKIQYRDGGFSLREWEDPDYQLLVERPA